MNAKKGERQRVKFVNIRCIIVRHEKINDFSWFRKQWTKTENTIPNFFCALWKQLAENVASSQDEYLRISIRFSSHFSSCPIKFHPSEYYTMADLWFHFKEISHHNFLVRRSFSSIHCYWISYQCSYLFAWIFGRFLAEKKRMLKRRAEWGREGEGEREKSYKINLYSLIFIRFEHTRTLNKIRAKKNLFDMNIPHCLPKTKPFYFFPFLLRRSNFIRCAMQSVQWS